MNQIELEKIIKEIMDRGNPKYSTSSGAFLEYLRSLAQQLNISDFAEACKYYTLIYPNSASYISRKITGIMANNYFIILPGFDYEKFKRWSMDTQDWDHQLKDYFCQSTKFNAAVDSIKNKVENYA